MAQIVILTPYEEIERLLIEKQIIEFYVEEKRDGGNVYAIFRTTDGRILRAKVTHNAKTNQIYPPTPSIDKIVTYEQTTSRLLIQGEPALKSQKSLFDWSKAKYVFSEKVVPKKARRYCDQEILEVVRLEDLEEVLTEIEEFISEKYVEFLQIAHTDEGNQAASVKEWRSMDRLTRIQLWRTNADPIDGDHNYLSGEGWALIYSSPLTYLIVGSFNAHPFVMTPFWRFDNSDGSSGDWPTFENPEPAFRTLTLDFLFNQIH